MKKKIAIMLTLILAAGTFTACTAEEKLNNDIQTSVVSKAADVSASTESSATATIEKATETTIPRKSHSFKRNRVFGKEYQIRRKSRQWAKIGGCFGNGSDSENTIRGPEQQQEYSE